MSSIEQNHNPDKTIEDAVQQALVPIVEILQKIVGRGTRPTSATTNNHWNNDNYNLLQATTMKIHPDAMFAYKLVIFRGDTL